MATIINNRPYNDWREKLAVDIIGGLVGNMIKNSQQANQNRKLNALRGVVQDELNAMNATQQQAVPQLMAGTGNNSSNGWQNAFHSMENPMAQFDAGTAGFTAPTVTPQVNNYPNQADIQGIIARNLASKRFSMLDPKLVQETLTPYLQANEAARMEQRRQGVVDDYMNAPDALAKRNVTNAAYLKGLIDLAGMNAFQNQYVADRPTPVSFNTGGNIVYGNRDPITGQISIQDRIPMELTPGQVQQGNQWQQTLDNNNRIDQRNFDTTQDQVKWERGMKEREFEQKSQPQYTIQAIDGKLWWVGTKPNVPARPFMIDGKQADAQQLPVNSKFDDRTKARLDKIEADRKSLNDRLRNLETQHAKAYGRDKEEIQKQIDEIKEQKRNLDNEFTAILYPPQNTQQSTGGNTPELMPRTQLGNSTDIGRNMLNGARNVMLSSAFNSPRPNGRKHMGVDYKTGKGEQVLVPDVGTSLTVKSVVIDPHNSYGNHVVLEGNLNGHKIEILMAHMDNGSVNLKQGQIVMPGDLVGLVGNTGNTSDRSKGGKITSWYEGKNSGYHLHLETKLDDKYIDPTQFINELAPFMVTEKSRRAVQNAPSSQNYSAIKDRPLYINSNGQILSGREYEKLLARRGGNDTQLKKNLITEGYTRIKDSDNPTQTTTPTITSPDIAPVNPISGDIPIANPLTTSPDVPPSIPLASGDFQLAVPVYPESGDNVSYVTPTAENLSSSTTPSYTDRINGTTKAQDKQQMDYLNGTGGDNVGLINPYWGVFQQSYNFGTEFDNQPNSRYNRLRELYRLS